MVNEWRAAPRRCAPRLMINVDRGKEVGVSFQGQDAGLDATVWGIWSRYRQRLSCSLLRRSATT